MWNHWNRRMSSMITPFFIWHVAMRQRGCTIIWTPTLCVRVVVGRHGTAVCINQRGDRQCDTLLSYHPSPSLVVYSPRGASSWMQDTIMHAVALTAIIADSRITACSSVFTLS